MNCEALDLTSEIQSHGFAQEYRIHRAIWFPYVDVRTSCGRGVYRQYQVSDLQTVLAISGALTRYLCRCQKAGGVLGAITAFIAYYVGLSELLNAEPQPVFNLPLGVIRNRRVD